MDWGIIFLILGMLCVGEAMSKTGLAKAIAFGVVDNIGPLGCLVAISGLYLLCSILTEMISNNAVAAVMGPLAYEMALQFDASSRAIIALEGPGQRKGNQSDWSKAPSFPWEQKTISLFRLKAGLFFYIILLLKKRTTENSSFIHPHSTDSQKFSQKRQLTNTRKRDSI